MTILVIVLFVALLMSLVLLLVVWGKSREIQQKALTYELDYQILRSRYNDNLFEFDDVLVERQHAWDMIEMLLEEHDKERKDSA